MFWYSCPVGMFRRSTPPSVIDPESGSLKRASRVARVDFPDPEGPTRAVTVPSERVSDTFRSAWVSS